MWSPIDGLRWPGFWVYVLVWVVLPVGIAVWRVRSTGRKQAEQWLAACGIVPIERLVPAAIEYVRWTRSWRSAGFVVGWLVAGIGPVITGNARTDWFSGGLQWVVVVVGYLLGAVVGELLRPRPLSGGAQLIWRRPTDAIPRWGSLLSAAALVVGLAVAWFGKLGDIDHAVTPLEPPADWIIWIATVTIAFVGWVGIMFIMRRPLRGVDKAELWLEEARRSTSVRAIAGATTAATFLSAITLVAALPLLTYPNDSTWRDLVFGVGLTVVGPALGFVVFGAMADLASPHPASARGRSEAEIL
ncbi:MAG: hypothetical protein GXP34_11565 [Actinobacteria bacterium]|nr:hypothetical protein [Actinomycetota bacterium]